MKKAIYSLGLIVLLFLVSGCKKEEVPVPDPAGTNTITLNMNVSDGYVFTIYKGMETSSAGPQGFPYVWLRFGMPDPALNFTFWTKYYTDATYSSWGPNTFGVGGEVINMGSVKGLGYVTDKPTTGYAGTTAVEIGHGYVLRVKHSGQYDDATLPYYYYRVYVTEWLYNVNGGIAGVKVKYQGPF